MPEDNRPVLVDVPPEQLEAMQKAGEALIDSMLVMLPPRGKMPIDEYDAFCQHMILGNAVVRILIAMSDKMGALDPGAIRLGAMSAINFTMTAGEVVQAVEPKVS